MLHAIAILLLSLTSTVQSFPLARRNGSPTILPLNLVGSSSSVTSKTIEWEIRRSVDRLHHGLDNYERNTGAPFGDVGTISERSRKRALGSNEALAPERSGTWWSAQIDVGSPPITVEVLLDTGSTDAWVVSSLCKNEKECPAGLKYEPTTNGVEEGLFNLGYHDGSNVTGKIFRDSLRVGDLQVPNVALGAADILEGMKDISAIFGLAFPATTRFGFDEKTGVPLQKSQPYTSFYETMLQQNLVGGNFSFSYAQDKLKGEFYLDGWNQDISQGDFHWLDLDLAEGEAPGFWNIEVDGVKVGDDLVLGPQKMMVDTGTNYMLGPKQEVDRFYGCIEGAKPLDERMWQVPCAQPDVAFTFGHREFAIPGSVFVQHSPSGVDLDEGYCVGMFFGDQSLDHWIMGQFAISNWYTTFDYKNQRVGFSTLKSGA